MKLPARMIVAMSVTLALASAVTSPTVHGQTARGLQAPGHFAGILDRAERSAALFVEAGKVFQHPRCVNCHPSGDRPLQGTGYPHQPPVQRGDRDGHGVTAMRCATCHQSENFDPARVPGARGWALAHDTMAWQGQSLVEICAQVKDRQRNGDRSLEQIVTHVQTDPRVVWAWNPGAGREPAPGTLKEFVALIEAWKESGAECPRRP